jgi:hypothetical protein
MSWDIDFIIQVFNEAIPGGNELLSQVEGDAIK